MKPRGFVFDLDGTLVHNMPIRAEAFFSFIERHGLLRLTEKDHGRFEGRRLPRVVRSDEVPRGKPHPDVFLEAARRLGVPPVADYYVCPMSFEGSTLTRRLRVVRRRRDAKTGREPLASLRTPDQTARRRQPTGERRNRP